MAIIDLKPLLSSSKFTTATYDDVSGDLTLEMATGKTLTQIVTLLAEGLVESANGKRTDLNSPIGNSSFTNNPSLVNRQNSNNTQSELQVEKVQSLSLFYVAPDLNSLVPVS